MFAQSVEIPSNSMLQNSLSSAYFFDCYAIDLPFDTRSPFELYLDMIARVPRWIDYLMVLRNKIVARMGLKDVGVLGHNSSSKASAEYCIGEQIGIFKLLENRADEAVLGETDKHLDVHISVIKQVHNARMTVSVSTVVHVHNWLGRVYMLFVAPAHRLIAPTTVTQLVTSPHI